jgi:hypothetical protein
MLVSSRKMASAPANERFGGKATELQDQSLDRERRHIIDYAQFSPQSQHDILFIVHLTN